MSDNFDAIVLGVGGMGSAAAFELARRGRRVLALERFFPGHDRGSSHGVTRVIRKAYYEHPDYVPLLRRAYERWYELEQLSAESLLTECGCLSVGPAGGEIVPGVLRAAEQHGLPVERLDAAELRRRFPQFRFDDSFSGVLERDAGFLYVESCVMAHVMQAVRHGADVRRDEPAVSWEATANGVVVKTAKGTYEAAKLVITAGAWAGRVLADLGLPLTVLRKTLFWFGTSRPERLRRDVFPIYMAETPSGFFYGFPVIDRTGHKVARHDGGEVLDDPARLERKALPGEEADCQAFLRAHLPDADGAVTSASACMYTVTPDHHFVIDLHPRHSHVVLAAGFSGHGFKFASVVGEVLADLAEGGRTPLPIGMFRLGRFA